MSDETLKKEGFSKFWTKDKTQALLGIGLIRTGLSGRFFIIVLQGQGLSDIGYILDQGATD